MKKIKKNEFLSKNNCKKLMLNLGQKREWTWLKLFMALMISKSLSWCTMGSKSFWSCNCTLRSLLNELVCLTLFSTVKSELAHLIETWEYFRHLLVIIGVHTFSIRLYSIWLWSFVCFCGQHVRSKQCEALSF